MKFPDLSGVRKAALAALGLAAEVAGNGLLPEKFQPWGAVIIALATAFGVWRVPNAPADPHA